MSEKLPHVQAHEAICKFIGDMAKENEVLKQRIKRLEEALTSIGEYWNRDNNERAMEDACWHAVNTAADALQAKEDKL